MSFVPESGGCCAATKPLGADLLPINWDFFCEKVKGR